MFNVYFVSSFFDTYGDNLSQLTAYSLNSSLKGGLSQKMVFYLIYTIVIISFFIVATIF